MKTFFAHVLVAACLAALGAQHHGKQPASHGKHKDKTASSEAKKDEGGRIVRGEPIGESPSVSLAEVLREPKKFADRRVVVEGFVMRVCKKEGCWMQIAPDAASEESVRVSFDHKFSIPKDADEMKFRAEGQFSVKVLSKEEVEHLVKDDGAKIKTNDDGTANEISFLATGVELWK